MEEIDDLRKKIDKIDKELVSLIEQRALVAKQIGDIKSKSGMGIVQQGREESVLKNVKQNLTVISPESVESIWKEIINSCKTIQGKE